MGTLFYKNMQKNNKSAELENECSIRKWKFKENFRKKEKKQRLLYRWANAVQRALLAFGFAGHTHIASM